MMVRGMSRSLLNFETKVAAPGARYSPPREVASLGSGVRGLPCHEALTRGIREQTPGYPQEAPEDIISLLGRDREVRCGRHSERGLSQE
jgi:hypothetical protein